MNSEVDNNYLSNAPLKEVIFEMHWDLDFIPNNNSFIDFGFDQALFDFQRNCGFENVEILNHVSSPLNIVSHRFYRNINTFPIYQMGPGVFTVNDNNKNYTWIEFKKIILDGINCLKDSYKNKEISPSKVELRYIDAVAIDIFGQQDDKFEFIEKYLSIETPKFNFLGEPLLDVSFTNRYKANENTYLNFSVSTGVDNLTNEDVLIWHTYLNNSQRIPWEGIDNWIEESHSLASDKFKKMINPKLYELFK
jgi:uncharacterized protein (TIGR04255 family)